MTTFIIYHLPGRKYGCTANLAERKNDYAPHQIRLLKIVAELDDAKEAERLETELNTAAGYRWQHVKYTHSIAIAPLGGKATAERGHNSFRRLTREEMAATGRKGGLIGGRVIRERGLGIFGLSEEQKAENRRRALARAAEVRDPVRLAANGQRLGGLRGVCPHCGFRSNLGNVAQHVARCEQKAETKPKA